MDALCALGTEGQARNLSGMDAATLARPPGYWLQVGGNPFAPEFAIGRRDPARTKAAPGSGWGKGVKAGDRRLSSISSSKSVPTLSPSCPQFVPVALFVETRMFAGFRPFVPVSPPFFLETSLETLDKLPGAAIRRPAFSFSEPYLSCGRPSSPPTIASVWRGRPDKWNGGKQPARRCFPRGQAGVR